LATAAVPRRATTLSQLAAAAAVAGLSLSWGGPAAAEEPADAVPVFERTPGREAPAGVMGSMLHRKGEWMLGLRAMRMSMDGNRDGGDELTDDEVRDRGYEMVPQEMTSTQLALEAMYGISDRVTLMGSVPFTSNAMDMLMPEGERFSMQASGLGDPRLGALVGLWHGEAQGLHLAVGFSLPTGDVDATDDMPDCADCKVDYPTQLGSGTWDFLPGLTWVAEAGAWSWGANWAGTLRLGENSEGYAFGNRSELSAWGVRHWNRTFSTSVRLVGSFWGNLDGADPDLDPMMSPSQDAQAQGGKRVDLLIGLGLKLGGGTLRRQRLALEGGVPLWQDLDGPQLATSWSATLGWQLWF
jgi:hypothetical protein